MNFCRIERIVMAAAFVLIAVAFTSQLGCAAPAPYPEGKPWKARWIWTSEGVAHKNYTFYARKTFTLPSRIASASVRVTADSRYRLYVNGVRVGRGPVKFDTRWMYYDTWDIAPLLKKGKNVIAVEG